MKKRQIQKYRKSNWNNTVLHPWSRYNCVNWGSCACGHPDVCGEDDYSDYDTGCRETHFAVNSFRKQLRKEHITLKGWYLFEIPGPHIYCFVNKRKKKAIELEIRNNCIEIYATDMKWKYHKGKGFNADRFGTIREALKAPYQLDNWR